MLEAWDDNDGVCVLNDGGVELADREVPDAELLGVGVADEVATVDGVKIDVPKVEMLELEGPFELEAIEVPGVDMTVLNMEVELPDIKMLGDVAEDVGAEVATEDPNTELLGDEILAVEGEGDEETIDTELPTGVPDIEEDGIEVLNPEVAGVEPVETDDMLELMLGSEVALKPDEVPGALDELGPIDGIELEDEPGADDMLVRLLGLIKELEPDNVLAIDDMLDITLGLEDELKALDVIGTELLAGEVFGVGDEAGVDAAELELPGIEMADIDRLLGFDDIADMVLGIVLKTEAIDEMLELDPLGEMLGDVLSGDAADDVPGVEALDTGVLGVFEKELETGALEDTLDAGVLDIGVLDDTNGELGTEVLSDNVLDSTLDGILETGLLDAAEDVPATEVL